MKAAHGKGARIKVAIYLFHRNPKKKWQSHTSFIIVSFIIMELREHYNHQAKRKTEMKIIHVKSKNKQQR